MPSRGLRGWIGPLLVTVLAGVLRFVDLGRPHAIIFDETYYVKDALALLRFGYEQQAVEGADELILEQDAPWDQLDIFTDSAAFVVHPPVGKWVIATGEWAFGVVPFGWRFGVAVLGTLSVLMAARIIRRLTRSDVVGTIAGLLVALDGLHIVMSRSALLDMSLMFLVLAAFGFLLLDRDAARRRAEAWRTLWHNNPIVLGPGFGVRPWRIAAGLSLGLACGVKWSGLWYVALFGLLTVYWDLQLRRELGASRPARGVLARDALPAFASIVGVGFVAYLATWSGWLVTDGGYDRGWAAANPGGLPFVPDALAHWPSTPPCGVVVPRRPRLRALLQVQRVVLARDVPADLVLLRVTQRDVWCRSMLRGGPGHREPDHLVGRVAGAAAQRLARRRRTGLAQRSAARGVPGWLGAVVDLPRPDDLHVLRDSAGPLPRGDARDLPGRPPGGPDASVVRRRWGILAVGTVLLLVLAATWFFLPVWTGEVLPYEQWDWRMWMPTWV